MKSGKQRRTEIKEKRLRKALELLNMDTTAKVESLPIGATGASVELLSQHYNSYVLPLFYGYKPLTCGNCGSKATRAAKQKNDDMR